MKFNLSEIKNKKKLGFILISAGVAVATAITLTVIHSIRSGKDEIKKSILVMFETEDECRDFIAEHGDEENPHEALDGVVPLMEDGYYNISGIPELELVFDMLKDGEYTTEPVEYSGIYCYIKRIGIDSPVQDKDELESIIRNDKMQQESR